MSAKVSYPRDGTNSQKDIPMIRAFCDSTTNGEWVIEVDGRRLGRFPGPHGAFAAAREANRLRAEARA